MNQVCQVLWVRCAKQCFTLIHGFELKSRECIKRQPRLNGCNLVAPFRRSKTVVIVQDTEELRRVSTIDGKD